MNGPRRPDSASWTTECPVSRCRVHRSESLVAARSQALPGNAFPQSSALHERSRASRTFRPWSEPGTERRTEPICVMTVRHDIVSRTACARLERPWQDVIGDRSPRRVPFERIDGQDARREPVGHVRHRVFRISSRLRVVTQDFLDQHTQRRSLRLFEVACLAADTCARREGLDCWFYSLIGTSRNSVAANDLPAAARRVCRLALRIASARFRLRWRC